VKNKYEWTTAGDTFLFRGDKGDNRLVHGMHFDQLARDGRYRT
jgi:hypothetical protein